MHSSDVIEYLTAQGYDLLGFNNRDTAGQRPQRAMAEGSRSTTYGLAYEHASDMLLPHEDQRFNITVVSNCVYSSPARNGTFDYYWPRETTIAYNARNQTAKPTVAHAVVGLLSCRND